MARENTMTDKTAPRKISSLQRAVLAVMLTLCLAHGAAADDKVQQDNTTPQSFSFTAVTAAINEWSHSITLGSITFEQNMHTALDKLTNTITEAMLTTQQADKARAQTLMPGAFDAMLHAQNGVMANNVTTIQEAAFNRESLQYLTANTKIGDAANDYIGGSLTATAKLFAKYTKYFCTPGSINAPTGCGSSAVDDIYIGSNLANSLIGESTLSKDSMTAASDFVRAYFGIIPSMIHTEQAQIGSYIDQQRELARTNMRLAAINGLLARRAPYESASSAGVVGKLFTAYNQAGLIVSSNPQAVCSKSPQDRTLREDYLCSVMNKEKAVSKTVADRILQFDSYMNPDFIEKIYSSTYPSRGALDRLEVTMRAQQLSQDYQFLRDLQTYTALRAVAISK